MIEIKIWSDFACPCCYNGETRLKKAIHELGIADKVDIIYKAFELDAAADGKPSATADAHRLMKLAERRYNQETTENLNEALFQAYFADGRDLSDREVLADIALEVGMDPEEVKVVLDSDRYMDAVHSDELEAYSLGVRGVPYFVINGTYVIPGALQVEDFKDALRKELNRGAAGEPVRWKRPHICSANGCVLIYV